MTVRKTGGVSTLAVIDGVREALPDIAADAQGRDHQGDLRPVGLRQGLARQRADGRLDGGRA
jgi:hypothetical protein